VSLQLTNVFLETKLQSVNCQSNSFHPRVRFCNLLSLQDSCCVTTNGTCLSQNICTQANSTEWCYPNNLGEVNAICTGQISIHYQDARCTVAVRSWSAVRVNVKHHSFTGLRMEFENGMDLGKTPEQHT